MSLAIKVENLSKRYLLSHQRQDGYVTFRDVLTRGTKGLVSKIAHPFSRRPAAPAQEEFWALNDVSFEIRQGDRIGIIGRNGAGKSTLLKILSRITEPTTGRITLRGRVASLLEIGTGFHPELTGRENIFLNGAILGMGKVEIRRKFDEIVNFADIEKFLDTPVKRYSSGMYIRLAFAVAAHLEPEILIVDEVLAVGDAEFQKKTLGKLENIGREGRTVLFVSHNMNSILQLTNQTLVLEQGQAVSFGRTQESVDAYMRLIESSHSATNLRSNTAWLKVTRFAYLHDSSPKRFNQPLCFELGLSFAQEARGIVLLLTITNTIGARIITSRGQLEHVVPGEENISLQVDQPRLVPGTYFINLAMWMNKEAIFEQENLLCIDLLADEISDPMLIPLVSRGGDKFGCYCQMYISRL